jgi:hypothetical protein
VRLESWLSARKSSPPLAGLAAEVAKRESCRQFRFQGTRSTPGLIYYCRCMTISKRDRVENHQVAFELMMRQLGDRAFDTTLFDAESLPFKEAILQTTWEELLRSGYVGRIGQGQYRLTAKGWLAGLELSGAGRSQEFLERVGRLWAAMKRHIKGRAGSAVVELRQIAIESNEPEGWIFNVIDSRASSSIDSARIGARWFENERGRLIQIPVDFSLEPIDIAAALTCRILKRSKNWSSGLRKLRRIGLNITVRSATLRFAVSPVRTFPTTMHT